MPLWKIHGDGRTVAPDGTVTCDFSPNQLPHTYAHPGENVIAPLSFLHDRCYVTVHETRHGYVRVSIPPPAAQDFAFEEVSQRGPINAAAGRRGRSERLRRKRKLGRQRFGGRSEEVAAVLGVS